jgi:hypothetical protein
MQAICKKQHRHAAIFSNLPDSQADDGRHKCAACAYEAGFMDGINNQPSNYGKIVHSLLDRQAGIVRHKDPEAVYDMGYADGKSKFDGC